MESVDIILSTLEFLSPEEILSTCRTSKKFQHVCNSQYLWKQLYTRRFLNNGANTLTKEEYEKDYKKAFRIDSHRYNVRSKILSKVKGITEYALLYLYNITDKRDLKKIYSYLDDVVSLTLYDLMSIIYQLDINIDILSVFTAIKPDLIKTLNKITDKLIEQKHKRGPSFSLYDLASKYCTILRMYFRNNINKRVDIKTDEDKNIRNIDIITLIISIGLSRKGVVLTDPRSSIKLADIANNIMHMITDKYVKE